MYWYCKDKKFLAQGQDTSLARWPASSTGCGNEIGELVPKSGKGYASEYYGETRMHGDEQAVNYA